MKNSRKVISMVLVLILSLSAMITATTVQTQAAQKLKYQVGKSYKKLTDKYKGDYAHNKIMFEVKSAGKISFKVNGQGMGVPATYWGDTLWDYSKDNGWSEWKVTEKDGGWTATRTYSVKKGDLISFSVDGTDCNYKIKCKGGALLKVTDNSGWEVIDYGAGW